MTHRAASSCAPRPHFPRQVRRAAGQLAAAATRLTGADLHRYHCCLGRVAWCGRSTSRSSLARPDIVIFWKNSGAGRTERCNYFGKKKGDWPGKLSARNGSRCGRLLFNSGPGLARRHYLEVVKDS